MPELQAACDRLRGGSNRYFSESFADQLRERLEAPASDSEPEAAVRGVLGRELLRLGRTDEAIAELDRARELSAAAGAEGRSLPEGLSSSVDWTLALAHLQQAEDQNCIAHRSADSCILPIGPGGVHRQPAAARRAGDLLLEYAKAHPRNIQAVWLLNLARNLSGDYPEGVPAAMRVPEAGLRDGAGGGLGAWPERGADLGIAVDDLAGGAVMDDFDGDGFLDLVSSTWDPCKGMTAFRNNGRGGFDDVSEQWGLSGQLGGLNLLQADYDNDGRIDLLVLRGAWLLGEGQIRSSLLRNTQTEGGVRFVDVTGKAGLATPAYPSQAAAWADYDGDGDLDLYVGNEATEASPFPSQLFENRGENGFVDVAASAGVENLRYAKGVAWGDYDNDGDPDLYVSNFGLNRLYRNDGPGRFVDVAADLGVVEPRVESFGTWFFDYDNDGDLDLFVADYRSQASRVTASYFGIESDQGQPLLYRNDLIGSASSQPATAAGTEARLEAGKPGFTEVSREVGIRRPAMPMGANFGDLDNDGWLDLYLGTGEPDLASVMPNQMYRNTGGQFVEVTFAGRFGHLQKGHGIAFGDLDNDGDQDLFHQLGGFYPADSFGNALFENPLFSGRDPTGDSAAAGHWVTLLLEGRKANRWGVGARVAVALEANGEQRVIHQVAGSGGSFGGSSLQLEIGLGDATEIAELVVRWPGSETVSRYQGVAVDRFYRVVEGSDLLVEVSRRQFRIVASGA